ncbi:MAG: hypothetical protein ABIU05_16260 [Nitrospirales bacterium]
MKADERNANPELGNQYTSIALDPVSKVIPSFHVSKRVRFIPTISENI